MLDYYTAWDFDSFDPDFFINESTGTGDGHKMGLWQAPQCNRDRIPS